MRKMSPEAIDFDASNAPMNMMLPLDAASTTNAWVMVSVVPPDAGYSMLAALVTVCASVAPEASVQLAAVTC